MVNNNDFTLFINWSIILLAINIIFYILTLLSFFSIIFMINPMFLKNSIDFKLLSINFLFFKLIIFVFLFLAGMPPFVTFFSKFFLFTSILTYGNLLILLGFFFLNGYSIYFYVQYLRIIINQFKVYKHMSNLLNFSFNFSLCYSISILFFFITFGFLFFFDIVSHILMFK